ncbi:MAG: hypothetical protein A2Z71_01000 [Chloroflexi bacterium RBG_13_50_21]|nr:MAG: hypothetical protein A2Z71_01000 [Chloroflexi bacterium RBG_13_50_21]
MADDGPGTLRQVLQDGRSGDIITFDPIVFPPTNPATISLSHCLPQIIQGNLTIDASNAGVVLDGDKIGDEWCSGLAILSNKNIVRGLRFEDFGPGAGIELSSGAQYNLIGGDPNIGEGPLGQGNMVIYGDLGLNISGQGTSHNTVRGNFIGTDPGGDNLGQTGTGIWISDGATNNTIGPGNTISYSQTRGIEIVDAETVGNTITQNSMHSNFGGGISLQGVPSRLGGNGTLPPPFITSFDQAAGSITGQTCSNCEVEFYSDENDQGKIYEGQITADGTGNFSFNRGTPFSGPHLTTTATDEDGNTSAFSDPITGLSLHIALQKGNSSPITRLQTKQSSDLEDNHIGSVGMSDRTDTYGQPHDLQAIMKQVVEKGLKHFRFTIVAIDGNLVDWDKPEFTYEPRHNDFITAMDNNGVMVTYLLSFRDDALGGEGRPLLPRFKTEEEIQRFLDYVRFIIGNVKGRIPYYEIWNEPNIRNSVQWIEVEDYINLVRRVVPVIRQEDPGAKIMLAGTTYLREPESHEYLFTILNSDIMPLVDVVSWHPMYVASPEFDSEYYYEYPSILQKIKDTATAHGFMGEYLASELYWWTEEESEEQGWGVWYSDIVAGKYHARGNMMHLGLGVSITNGAVPSGYPSRHFVDTVITNLCTIMAGAEATSLPVEIETEATNVRSYSFSLPNGDYLVTLWTDGVAVDDDPGINATLTLPNISADEVVGIDVLYSFEQQIITTMEDGNLVMHDILVKDYPIILRFKDASSP